LANCQILDVGAGHQFAFVGDQRERPFGGNLERIVLHLFPDRGVNAVGVAWSGREWIDDQQVDAVFEKFTGLVDEGPECMPVGLVAGRDDFDHRDNAVAADVPHHDRTLLAAIERDVGFDGDAGPGTRLQGRRRAGIGSR